MRPVLLIGDLASMTGLSIHTINYYIRLGLIKAVTRSERSGYRLFSRETVEQLASIMALRRKKVPIRELLSRKKRGLL